MSGMIDAHTHFWQLDRGDYSWLTPALAPIHRDFGPADLEPFLTRHGITGTILVQAAPTVAETRYLLEVARRTPFVAGVVGWADFEAPDAADVIAALAADPLLVGMRPMVQDIADDDWLVKPFLGPAFRALVAHDLIFDALTLPRHLTRLDRLLDRHPELTVVVDHASKPAIRERRLDSWRADIAAIAAHPGVFCKLSGLATEATPDWTTADLKPYVEHLVEGVRVEGQHVGAASQVVQCLRHVPGRQRADPAQVLGQDQVGLQVREGAGVQGVQVCAGGPLRAARASRASTTSAPGAGAPSKPSSTPRATKTGPSTASSTSPKTSPKAPPSWTSNA